MAEFVIDCGHGGDSRNGSSSPLGLVGPGGLREKDVTLLLGKRVAAHLGGRATLTRDGDVNPSLGERAELARRLGAPVFVSLHVGETGGQTWIHSRSNPRSRALGEAIHREMAVFGNPSGGLRAAELALLTPERLAPSTAACLIEIGSIADPGGERRLRDPAALEAAAAAIARGVRSYAGADTAGTDFGDGQAAGAFDFWAVWCRNEECFIGGIWFTQQAAAAEASRHMRDQPGHRAYAVLLSMGSDQANMAGIQAPRFGEVVTVPETHIRVIGPEQGFTLSMAMNNCRVTRRITVPPAVNGERDPGTLSLVGQVTNESGTPVEFRGGVTLALAGSETWTRSQVLDGHFDGDFQFEFPNVARNKDYLVDLSLNTSDYGVTAHGAYRLMISD
jgi:hypothetical protein